jgi:hypothetical protein
MEILQPFGEVCYENEIKTYGDNWDDFYFTHTNHYATALKPITYLIVGRRGSGKSSLVQYLQHNTEFPNPYFISVGKADDYNTELYEFAKKLDIGGELSINKICEVWQFVFWQCIFKKLSNNQVIAKGISKDSNDPSVNNFIRHLLNGLLNKFEAHDAISIYDALQETFKNQHIKDAQKEVYKLVNSKSLFLIIDSKEKYNRDDINEMRVTTAQIKAANEFNSINKTKNIFIKLCVADEIFPYLKEEYIPNTLKDIQYPLYMFWKPKDLMRLISWRLFKFLQTKKIINWSSDKIKWNDYKNIKQNILDHFFAPTIKNRRGIEENTIPYILRHTQLRPRQLVVVCNAIAARAEEMGYNFNEPFSAKIIKEALVEAEVDLADEIINSYSSIYEKLGDMVSALEGMPMIFKANELNKCAQRVKRLFSKAEYSPENFKKILIEIGVIGRVRGTDDITKQNFIEADFEYFVKDRVYINEDDNCVIHPMFFAKLNINRSNFINKIVYPFPDHPDYNLDEL